MKRLTTVSASAILSAALLLPLAGCDKGGGGPGHSATAGTVTDRMEVNRGRRFVAIMGCNDCHTAGYSQNGGNVPEGAWLTGTDIGWHGPWGTTYAGNLRKLVQTMSPDDWVKLLRAGQMRPPMPAYVFKNLQDQELGYIYAYIKSLGPVGDDAPAFLPPGKMPPAPYVEFVMPEAKAKK